MWHDPTTSTLEHGQDGLDRSSPLGASHGANEIRGPSRSGSCAVYHFSLVFVSRDENEMTIAEANGITCSSGRCDDNSITKSGTAPAELSGPFPGRRRLDKYRMRDKARYQSLGSSNPHACPPISD